MKKVKILLTLIAIIAMCTNICACRQNGKEKAEGQTGAKTKTIVAYFSATGTTAKAARQIADETGGELHEIVPAEAYTAADLDWNNKQSRSSIEMNDPKSRPAIKADNLDMGSYDVVYIGYPIWWGVAPRIINTFIESHDLKGKQIIPFATSGGSGIGQSVDSLNAAYTELDFSEGKLMN